MPRRHPLIDPPTDVSAWLGEAVLTPERALSRALGHALAAEALVTEGRMYRRTDRAGVHAALATAWVLLAGRLPEGETDEHPSSSTSGPP